MSKEENVELTPPNHAEVRKIVSVYYQAEEGMNRSPQALTTTNLTKIRYCVGDAYCGLSEMQMKGSFG